MKSSRSRDVALINLISICLVNLFLIYFFIPANDSLMSHFEELDGQLVNWFEIGSLVSEFFKGYCLGLGKERMNVLFWYSNPSKMTF